MEYPLNEVAMLIPILALIPIVLGILFFLNKRRKGGSSSTTPATPSEGPPDAIKKPKHNPMIEGLRRHAAKNPSNPTILQQFAVACYEDERYQDSFDAYTALINLTDKMNPESVPSGIDVRRCRIRKGISAIHIRKYDEAFRVISDVFAAKKELDGELLWGLGVCEYYRKKYDRAAHYLTFVIKGFPDNTEAYRYLGMSYYKMNRYTETANILQHILAKATKDDDKELIFTLADAYYRSGNRTHALKLFRYLREDPTYGPTACLSSGKINTEEGRFPLAITDFETGLGHANMRTELMLDLKYSLAQAFVNNKDLRKAMELFQQVRAVNPSFKNVSQEIQRYGEKASSVHVITYLKGTSNEFVELATKILTLYFGKTKFSIDKSQAENSAFTDIVGIMKKGKHEESIVQVRFYRTEATLSEAHMRDLYLKMKANHAERGYCFTIGGFEPQVDDFVEHRLIDLCSKEILMGLLVKIP
ncbi:MAG: tetratricopeptide repeat protein [Spirochaetia bacterium]